ncbi:AsnC family transcriptional regulator [Elstera cyanobacteriorum]|uniref:AsnC family transcriptional regulator n=1 Tax=Elstera cyanobacteriorum TaxID=2022747 RepID=A0A255XN36_9PROT|nr:Lrp/AsnC family transcriptional regulator [Elstera cyanobacteriorum]OYQ17845.1 AsnC family transcriptional regulator [Elstera cyanobacteriorum]GFZ85596.1 AsnC family transcriptional regulator [Elstera cyanobacteriorum]
MPSFIVSALDAVDRALVEALAADARQPLNALAKQVGLSAPSVSDRLKRLEGAGVIRGYTVDLDQKALGYRLQAIVRVKPLPGQLHMVQRALEEQPYVIECDKVTGDDCFIVRIVLRDIEQLDEILEGLSERAETSSAIVKASPVPRRLPPLG